MSDVPPPASPDESSRTPKSNPRHARPKLRKIIAVFRARQWAQVGYATLLAMTGLGLWVAGHDTALVIPGVALVAFAVVSLLGESPSPSVLVRRSGRDSRMPTPSALLWLWCFAALMTALLVWRAMDLVKPWMEAEAGRRTDVVVTSSSYETRVTSAIRPAR